MTAQTKLCPKCGRVCADDAKKCECGYSFDSDESLDENESRRQALALWLGVGRFNAVALALACGVVWGLVLFLITWWVIMFDGATGETTLIGRIYRGYTISPLGSVVGLLWGLVDGAIAGLIFAWLYNGVASWFASRSLRD